MLAAFAACFGRALPIFGKVAAATAMSPFSAILAVFALSDAVVIFMALLASLHMLFVRTTSVRHCFLHSMNEAILPQGRQNSLAVKPFRHVIIRDGRRDPPVSPARVPEALA
jgi:hypothetical protein